MDSSAFKTHSVPTPSSAPLTEVSDELNDAAELLCTALDNLHEDLPEPAEIDLRVPVSSEALLDLFDAVGDLVDQHPELNDPHPEGGPCADLACRVTHAALALAHNVLGRTAQEETQTETEREEC